MMSSAFLKSCTNALERLMVLMASAIHDVGHEGRNNNFYMQTMHALAIRYNSESVLENMHAATAFEIMLDKKNDCNWWELLKTSKEYMRKGLIRMVLATDPVKTRSTCSTSGKFWQNSKISQ